MARSKKTRQEEDKRSKIGKGKGNAQKFSPIEPSTVHPRERFQVVSDVKILGAAKQGK